MIFDPGEDVGPGSGFDLGERLFSASLLDGLRTSAAHFEEQRTVDFPTLVGLFQDVGELVPSGSPAELGYSSLFAPPESALLSSSGVSAGLTADPGEC